MRQSSLPVLSLVCLSVVFSGACGGAQQPVTKPPIAPKKQPLPPPKSVADPQFLKDFAQTYRFRLGNPRAISVTPDGKKVLFLRSGPRTFVQDLFAFDLASKKETVLLTAKALLKGAAEHLSAEEKARRERMRQTARGLASYALSKDGKRLLVPLSGRLYIVELANNQVTELSTTTGKFALDPQLSPSGELVSYVIEGDLYVYDIGKKKERKLTKSPSPDITFGAAEFVAQEEMRRRHGNWWSPDSDALVVQKTDNSAVERLHVYDPAHPEKPSRGSAYPRPGKKNAVVTLNIQPIGRGKPIPIRWDNTALPYVTRVVWSKHGPLTIVVQDRAQRTMKVLAVDRKTGQTTELLEEKDAAWINIDPQMPRWLPNKRFLWTSERAGAWQLELRNGDGKLLRVLTEKALGYRKLLGLDAASGHVWFAASDEPTQTHLWELWLDRKDAPRQLTKTPGQHGQITGKDGTSVRVADTIAAGRKWIVHTPDGKVVGQLASVAATPSFRAKPQFLTVGDKAYRAMLFRPRNYDPKRKYPVIVYVYGGPHWAVVNQSSARLLMRQWIADHGYLVASFDGRGTPHRGRAWERAISGNFIQRPMADQVAALQALAAKVPQVDLKRVGIFGWSFGGYFSAMAVMRRPDVYKAAVAGAPVADWRDYDTHYTERYIGTPASNPNGYRDSSVLTWAPKLGRPLLLIHGTADDNVYFTHAIKMSDAMFRAGKHHEFLPLTGFTHMVADPKVLQALYDRILGHFQRNL